MTDIVETVLGHEGQGRAAIISPAETTSYDELADLTRRLAAGLRRSPAPGPGTCLVVTQVSRLGHDIEQLASAVGFSAEW